MDANALIIDRMGIANNCTRVSCLSIDRRFYLMILFTRLRAALAAWDIILLAIALTVAAFYVWPGWLRQAREAGALGERLVWQERQRRSDIQRETERETAQVKIDMAERQLLDTQTSGAIRINELETAIAEERKVDATAPDSVVGRPACGPIPERVRGALNSIGR